MPLEHFGPQGYELSLGLLVHDPMATGRERMTVFARSELSDIFCSRRGLPRNEVSTRAGRLQRRTVHPIGAF